MLSGVSNNFKLFFLNVVWDVKQFQAAPFYVVWGVHLHLPMYMPGVGVCARLVIEKSTRIFLPSRTIEENV